MTEPSKKIMKAFYKDFVETTSQKISVANVLRELISIFDDEGYAGDEPCCCVFRDIIDIIEELEK
jgi:hypothetical protein